MGNLEFFFDRWHLISTREIIDKKESLTDLARENRGYRRPAISLKNLATKEAKVLFCCHHFLLSSP
jgi:hypothetical protein